MAGLDPKVMQVLGLAPSAANDAHAVVMAVLKKTGAPLRAILNRSTHRTGLSVLTIQDEGKTAKIKLSPASTGADELGAQIASFLTHSPGAMAVFLDEGARMLVGMPEGPKAKALDAPIEGTVSPTTLALLGPSGARGIFGIDDALIIAALPVIATLFVAVLPFLISIGGSIISMVTGALAPKPSGPPAPPPPANIIDAEADKLGIGTPGVNDTGKVIAIVVAAVLVVWLVRKYGKKAAG